ncbi:aldo/keto reductase [Actinophytocola gossypii]|uniref:aldo/keto reductase n=1 Tax=Actinophytocola gossypii TaxID=2812003 RepID=UPI0021A5C743|nr:aldo/keto reductase [Actinophytocola gossypii]
MRGDDLVPLGRTGLTVSRLGLGLASIGGLFAPVPEPQALATVDHAWDLGVRLYDTAPVYGYGRSEQYAGRSLAARPRAEFVLCTKVGRLIEPGGPDTQPIWADPPSGLGPRLDYSYAGVRRSVDASLDRLGTDRIDVLHVHDPDQDFPAAVTGAYRALAELRAEGTIAAVSIGVNHADVAARFLREAAAPGPDCVLLAGRYTLLDQSGLADLLPLCHRRGVSVIAAGVYQGGLLTGRDDPRVQAWQALCDRHDVPLPAVALRFPFAHPAVDAAVVGARSPREIADSMAWLSRPVPPALWHDAKRAGLLAEDVPAATA